MSDYPQSDRLASLSTEYGALHEFLDHLSGEGVWLARYEDVGYRDKQLVPIGEQHEAIVLAFLGIDRKALERERRTMLRSLSEVDTSAPADQGISVATSGGDDRALEDDGSDAGAQRATSAEVGP